MKKIILLNEKNEKMYFFSSEELRVVAEGKKLQPVWKDTVFRTEDKIYLRGRNNLCRQIAEKARFLTFPVKEDIFHPQVTSWGMRAFFDHGNGKDKLTELSPELADAWIEDGVELVKKHARRIAAVADMLVIGQLVLVTLASAGFENQFGGL